MQGLPVEVANTEVVSLLLQGATALALLFGGILFKRLLATLDKLDDKVKDIHTEVTVQREVTRLLENRLHQLENNHA